MSLTNAEVSKRFQEGKTGHNSRNSLASVRPFGGDGRSFVSQGMHSASPLYEESVYRAGQEGATILYSYATAIALRRDRDGLELWDAHSYSITTSQHGGSHRGLSFRCLDQLLGAGWWRKVRVLEELPQFARHSDACNGRRDILVDAWRNLPDDERASADYPGYNSRESESCDPECRQAKAAGTEWIGWTLLRFPRYDVLCGGDFGRVRKYEGRADQLFAVKLPGRAETVNEALALLRPEGADGDTPRQGDLFFIPVGLPLKGGRSGPVQVRGPRAPKSVTRRMSYMPLVGYRSGPIRAHPYRHEATRVLKCDGAVYVKGYVEHPEHKRIHLTGWHRATPSRAVLAVSADQTQPMGSGRVGGD